MKPFSEKLKELRKLADQCDERKTDYWRAFAMGTRASANSLQAWSREAETWTREAEEEGDSLRAIWTDNIREELLGTTQSQVKQEGEK